MLLTPSADRRRPLGSLDNGGNGGPPPSPGAEGLVKKVRVCVW